MTQVSTENTSVNRETQCIISNYISLSCASDPYSLQVRGEDNNCISSTVQLQYKYVDGTASQTQMNSLNGFSVGDKAPYILFSHLPSNILKLKMFPLRKEQPPIPNPAVISRKISCLMVLKAAERFSRTTKVTLLSPRSLHKRVANAV